MSRRSPSFTTRRAAHAGLLVAGTNVPLTLQRTLMPRGTLDQALVTGLSISTNHVLVTALQDTINASVLRWLRGRGQAVTPRAFTPAAIVADMAAAAAGLAVQRGFAQRADEPLLRAALRSTGYWATVTGVAGMIVNAVEERAGGEDRAAGRALAAAAVATGALASVGEWRRRRAAALDSGLPEEARNAATVRALAFGATFSVGASALTATEARVAERVAAILARASRTDEVFWRPVGHVVALGAAFSVARLASQRALARIESGQGAVETAFDVRPPSPMVSGSRESEVPFETLSVQGRRFVWMVTPQDIITSVTHVEDVLQPARVYVGLDSAPSERERVDLALRELDRTHAFDRSWLLVVSPTGTGYVNYAAVSALELLARGDCATVALQYAARPSVLSLRRVSEGRAHMTMLLEGIRERVAARAEEARPKVVLFGESLGAWTSQDPFVDGGTAALMSAGVDRAIWIGTPHFSKWKNQVLGPERPDVDPSVLGVFDRIEDWRALDDATRKQLRFVMITHTDDGVACFGPELAVQAPQWLGEAETRPDRVPRGMRWMPTTTFFQVLVDMKNSANVVPGVFAAKGHDYRADLLPFFDAVLGFETPAAELGRIAQWLEARELMRTEWVRAHGDAGRSLSATVLERLIDEQRAAGTDTDAALLRVIREVAAPVQQPA
jgi:uncharacterized membrane protein